MGSTILIVINIRFYRIYEIFILQGLVTPMPMSSSALNNWSTQLNVHVVFFRALVKD